MRSFTKFRTTDLDPSFFLSSNFWRRCMASSLQIYFVIQLVIYHCFGSVSKQNSPVELQICLWAATQAATFMGSSARRGTSFWSHIALSVCFKTSEVLFKETPFAVPKKENLALLCTWKKAKADFSPTSLICAWWWTDRNSAPWDKETLLRCSFYFSAEVYRHNTCTNFSLYINLATTEYDCFMAQSYPSSCSTTQNCKTEPWILFAL